MSLNYIGSKTSLLPFLDSHIKVAKGQVFGDLFAGTGSVGHYFCQKYQAKIIANDICYYSYILNMAKLIPFSQQEFDYHHQEMSKCSSIGFISNNYTPLADRLYFSLDNGKRIDGSLEYLRATDISPECKNALKASILYGADHIANVASVYGAFLKKLKKTAQKEISFPRLETSTFSDNQVYNLDVFDLKNIQFDIVYIDTPYNQRGYCSNYHILETIAIDDNPEIRLKTGLRFDTGIKNSCFTRKTQVREAFIKLIEKLSKCTKYIFLSYSSEGIVPIAELWDLFIKYGSVQVHSTEYKRFKSNAKTKDNKVIEYLFEIEIK